MPDMPDIVPDMPDMPSVDVPDVPSVDVPDMPSMPGFGGPKYKTYYGDNSDYKDMRVYDLSADSPEEALEWYEVLIKYSYEQCKSKADGTRL
jgi:hypothetical protein